MKYLKRFNESEELGKWWHPHFDDNNEGQDEADICSSKGIKYRRRIKKPL